MLFFFEKTRFCAFFRRLFLLTRFPKTASKFILPCLQNFIAYATFAPTYQNVQLAQFRIIFFYICTFCTNFQKSPSKPPIFCHFALCSLHFSLYQVQYPFISIVPGVKGHNVRTSHFPSFFRIRSCLLCFFMIY